jgi:hypothetical protein
MRAVVIGFPKAGTSTLQTAISRAGLRAFHQIYRGRPIGRLVYAGLLRHGDPFHFLPDADVLTQMDICRPESGENFWPNLDLAVLAAIRARRPDCLMILNRRDPAAIAGSIGRWYDLQARIVASDVPGLPRGFGGTAAELERWITGHYDAVTTLFGGGPGFLDLEITSEDARERLGAFLGLEIPWWGQANQSPPHPRPAAPRGRTAAAARTARTRKARARQHGAST